MSIANFPQMGLLSMGIVTSDLYAAVDELKPFSDAAVNLLAACRDPNRGPRDIARIIEFEPALCARVFQIANGSSFGFANRIRSIDHAVVTLGLRAIQDIALVVAASELFAGGKEAGRHRRQIWQHSLACGVISRQLAARSLTKSVSEAFLSGIFHDVGKLAFLDADPDRYGSLNEESEIDRIIQQEEETYGVSHQQIGSYFATKWGLGREIVSVIEFHHTPANAKQHTSLVEITSDANVIAHAWGMGTERANFNAEIVRPLPFVGHELALEIRSDVEHEFQEALKLCGG